MNFRFFLGAEGEETSNQDASSWFSFGSVRAARAVSQYLNGLWFIASPTNGLTELFFALRGISAKAVFSLVLFNQMVEAAGRQAHIAFQRGVYRGGQDLCRTTPGFGIYSYCKSFFVTGENNTMLARGVLGMATSPFNDYKVYL